MLAVLVFGVSCSKEKTEVQETISSADLVENVIENPRIVISKGEKITVRAVSDKLEKGRTKEAVLSGNVVADIFNEFGEHMSILTSDSAKINELSNNFEAFGHVIVKSDSGLTLYTSRLMWDNRYKLITSNDSVMFTTQNNDTLYGVGFTSDMDLSHWKILEPTGVTGKTF